MTATTATKSGRRPRQQTQSGVIDEVNATKVQAKGEQTDVPVPIEDYLPELRAEEYAQVLVWDRARMELQGQYEAFDGHLLRQIRAVLKPKGHGLWKQYYTVRNIPESTVNYRIGRANGKPPYPRNAKTLTVSVLVNADPVPEDTASGAPHSQAEGDKSTSAPRATNPSADGKSGSVTQPEPTEIAHQTATIYEERVAAGEDSEEVIADLCDSMGRPEEEIRGYVDAQPKEAPKVTPNSPLPKQVPAFDPFTGVEAAYVSLKEVRDTRLDAWLPTANTGQVETLRDKVARVQALLTEIASKLAEAGTTESAATDAA